MNEQKKENLLTIEDLVVEYDTDEAVVQAVNHVNLQLGRGETLGLVGETGAGKRQSPEQFCVFYRIRPLGYAAAGSCSVGKTFLH